MVSRVLGIPMGGLVAMGRTTEELIILLETRVRERICGVCSDRTVDGDCGLEDPSSCALFQLFPHVVQAVESTNSDDIRDYIRAIRRDVCSICVGQAADGSCEARREVRCALDAYLLPIVDVIEEATGKKFSPHHLG